MADVDAARNGSYTCQASIDSSSQFITGSEKTSGSVTITVGEYQLTCMVVSAFPSDMYALRYFSPHPITSSMYNVSV
jgi:hypothetical protein